MEIIPNLLAVIALVLANGFFVASEFALVAVRRSRVEQLAAEGHPQAAILQRAIEHLNANLAAAQLGVTMASLALGWIGEPALASLLEPVFHQLLPEYWGLFSSHAVAAVLTFGVITALHIVVGEQAPKMLALQRTEAIAMAVALPLELFRIVFRPAIGLLNGASNLVLRLLGLQPTSGEALVHSAEELRLLVVGSREAGVLDETEADIVTRVLGFAELAVREVMVPRTEIQALPVTATLEEAIHRAATSGYSRFPVYEGDLDHIVGILYVKDLFAVLEQGAARQFDLRRIVRPPLLVPDSLPVDTLLLQLQRERQRMALVVDEFGGIAGLVTLQDVLERIVGQFGDEFEAPQPPAVPQPDGSLLVDGLARIEDVAAPCGLHITEEDTQTVETIGGLVMLHLGRLPKVGDEVRIDDTVLRVEEMDGHRVARVRVVPTPKPASR
ncbi:MAG TPA: hemolysin family protein [Chloroflexota bacterium]|nr:hemolysin family protein [Chloroflexota bacterium]